MGAAPADGQSGAEAAEGAQGAHKGGRWEREKIAFVLVLVAGALLGAFLDPSFGANARTVLSFMSILVAMVFGVFLSGLVTGGYHRARKHGKVPFKFEALPGGLVVAAVCVLISRGTGFAPGYLYGIVCGVGYTRKLAKNEEGHLVALGAAAKVVLAVAAWAAWSAITRDASKPGTFFGTVLVDDFLASLFVSGMVGTVLSLFPLRFMPGHKLKQWHTGVWALTFGVSFFLLVQVLLRPHSGSSGRSHVPLVTTIVLFVVFAGGSLLFRDHFVRKERRLAAAEGAAASITLDGEDATVPSATAAHRGLRHRCPAAGCGGSGKLTTPRAHIRIEMERTDAERERLAATFNGVAQLYHRARPEYPDALYDHLIKATRLGGGDRLLEVGCGTGKATLALARRGFRLTCVEPGPALAAAARANLAGFDVGVVEAKFENVRLARGGFDVAFAATAWHWVDHSVGYQKLAAALRPGGYFAFWSATHVRPDDGDPFFDEIQPVYDEIGEGIAPGAHFPRPGELSGDQEELEASGLFRVVDESQYDWETVYDADSYIDLLNTFSGHIAMEPWQRDRLYGENPTPPDGQVGRAIEEALGGSPPDRAVLYLSSAGRRKDGRISGPEHGAPRPLRWAKDVRPDDSDSFALCTCASPGR